jgi:S-(hydroxymethyl)mycothiol dehydrogenase
MTLTDGTELSPALGIGAFAEQTLVAAGQATKVDPRAKPEVAGLLGCGVMAGLGAAMYTGGVGRGDSIAVFGCGGVGLSIIQGARLAGAGTIIAVDVAPQKLEMASKFGATHTANGSSEDAVGKCKELTGGIGPDFTFEAVGIPDLMVQAYNAVRRGGTVTIVGVGKLTDNVPFNALLLSMDGKTVKGSYYGDTNFKADFPKLLGLYQCGKLNLDDMVTRTYTIDEAPQAFVDMEKGLNARGVIVYN